MKEVRFFLYLLTFYFRVCHWDISSVAPSPDVSTEETLSVNLCTASSEMNQANIWEIAFSAYNDSSKLEGSYFI